MKKQNDQPAGAKKSWKRPELIEEDLHQTQNQPTPPMLPGAPDQAS